MKEVGSIALSPSILSYSNSLGHAFLLLFCDSGMLLLVVKTPMSSEIVCFVPGCIRPDKIVTMLGHVSKKGHTSGQHI